MSHGLEPDTDYRCPTCGRDGFALHHCDCPIPSTPATARVLEAPTLEETLTWPAPGVQWVPLLAADLRRLGACREQVVLFRRTFPNGATPEDVEAAVAAGLSVEWVADALCDSAAWATYGAATAPAWATYGAATAPALATYGAATAAALATYGAATAAALATYGAATAPAWATYGAARAAALADALAACWPVWEGA